MMKFSTFLKHAFRYGIATCLISSVLVAGLLTYVELTLPNVTTLKDVHLQTPLRVFSADNKLIAQYGNIRRTPITLNEVPKQLIQATLATEDQRFFEHSGVDLIGLARAAIILVTTGQKQQGGSTITMQVARNYFLTRKKTYMRKLKEILLAFKIDHTFSKDKILELYFNKIFYGNRAYGLAAAAQIYYGKKLNELTLSEITMIAGLPKAPSILNPLANPAAAKDRRNHVLYRMFDMHMIDKATYEATIQEPLTAKYHGFKVSVNAPYIAEMVRQLMLQQYGKNAYTRGFNVYTTLNGQLQTDANTALFNALIAYDHRHGYREPEKNLGTPNLANLDPWTQALSKISTINHLQAAAVLSLDDQSATALLQNSQVITLTWLGINWARKQIIQNNQEFLGPLPKTASDIIHVGDVIRVCQNPDQSWSLEQLPKAEAALVALNPKNGAIVALDGGFNFFESKFNRAIQAARQPGSAFKPFIYSAALAKNFTLATTINDAPVVMSDSGINNLWRPENDTGKFYGPTRLRVALDQSRNLASIRLLQMIGVHYTTHYLTRFGFKANQLPPTLSLALGAATITPLQLATAYAIFANNGYRVQPYYIDQIVNAQHHTIYKAQPLEASDSPAIDNNNIFVENHNAPQVITPQNAYLITSALQGVIKHGTGRTALVLKRNDIAGKTGTTNDKKDAWFSGFNGNLVATVWMGYDDNSTLYEYGAKAALPMWINFMHLALAGQPETKLTQPPGIVTARIDRASGLLAPPGDHNTTFEVFRKNLAPKHYASFAATVPSTSDDNELY